ncbi:MAG: hypothetical protein OXG57_04205 [Acidimicrobiaceae bacterium]|nr:hypothetical protein [Acidimicrobiaceae bacterium]MCY3607627.1 hypothetical protein [Acidimicrobiaceae bacterium]MDE0320581.1 hypothetical protein [Acidimicrobiaceae bacterium]
MRSAAGYEVDGLWRCELRVGTPAPAHPSRIRFYTLRDNSLVEFRV